ncbi:cysteine-rich DPF motif domain-containing protein 1-like [Asterias rubens]|uniref:cysteine-rich DPF motif domain-containing protein 1-like n=1 Tax=Asterias rubens TaxID=7604 RepID=UPI00145517A9|nr:cysteine-rich DPF motif domain-containing protein 1-like [Asterias rubens]
MSSQFQCDVCDFKSPYDYYGSKPPFVHAAVSLKEEVYILKDPFVAEKRHITVGSHCSICRKAVCAGQDCSLFYTKRFCLQCVKENITEFPNEIKKELERKGIVAKE